MSTKNTNKLNVPQARAAMDKFKMEAASEVDVYPPQKAPAAPAVSSRSIYRVANGKLSKFPVEQ